MSSKKVLYKPANQDSAAEVKDKSRKALPQGRLVEQPLSNTHLPLVFGVDNFLSVDTAENGYAVSLSANLRHFDTPTTSGSQDIGKNSASFQKRELGLSPRRQMPQMSTCFSPKSEMPSKLLDISDSEIEINTTDKLGLRNSLPLPGVIVVDALRQTKSHDDSEVDIQMGIEASPSRVVICHQPVSRIHRELRQAVENMEERKRHITVDKVPSVIIGDPAVDCEEHYHSDCDRDRYFHIRRNAEMDCGEILEHGPTNPNDRDRVLEKLDACATNALHRRSVSQIALKMTSIEDEDIGAEFGKVKSSCDLEVKPTEKKSAGDIRSDGVKSKTTVEKQRMPKGGRIVPSKYKQAANAVAASASKGPLKATDRSIMTQHERLLNQQTGAGLSNPRSSSNGRQKTKGTKSSAKGDMSHSDSNQSGMSDAGFDIAQGASGGAGRVSSTPTGDGSLFPLEADDVDASFIAPCRKYSLPNKTSTSSLPDVTPQVSVSQRRTHKSASDREFNVNSMKSSRRMTNEKAAGPPNAMPPNEISQHHLDMYYGRYLQFIFLESKKKKVPTATLR